MPTGPTPTAAAVFTTVTVAWPDASVGGGAVAGYVVKRYDAVSGTASAVGGTCAGIVSASSCTDASAPLGTWRYSVTPVHYGWAGAEGARSITVAVAF